jgi:hypothetical protein
MRDRNLTMRSLFAEQRIVAGKDGAVVYLLAAGTGEKLFLSSSWSAQSIPESDGRGVDRRALTVFVGSTTTP